MKIILKCHETKQKLTEKSEEIATLIKLKIKCILSASSYISIALDEWSDSNRNSYLGMEARFFLTLTNIDSVHFNGFELLDMLNVSLEQCNIRDKVFAIVSDNCNLMSNALMYSSILGLPCICNLINLFLRTFI